mgnify:CR=1 FL=1
MSNARVVLVPNNASLRMCEAEHYRRTGARGAARAPAIEVFSLWAGRLLETSELLLGSELRPVPDRFRLLALWERIVAEHDTENWLPNDIAATAREAAEADRLLRQWFPDRAGPGPARVELVGERFDRWQRAYHGALAREGWRDETGRLEALRGLLARAGGLPTSLPERVLLRGFVELTPLEQSLLRGLETLGVAVEAEAPLPDGAATDPEPEREPVPEQEQGEGQEPNRDAPAMGTPDLQAFRYRSSDDELRAAARWALERVAQGQRVALAVVGLDGRRDRIARALAQVFQPEEALGVAASGQSRFHVQGGVRLDASPLVQDALDLLELSAAGVRRAQPFTRVSRWMLSPAWVGSDRERPARARLELFLRRRGGWSLSLAAAAKVATERECPVLGERVARLPPGARAGTGAAERFYRWLEHWGWPGPAACGRSAQAAVDGLRAGLEALDFAAVDDDERALALLRRHCRERRMAGAGGPLSPVQVLELQDIVGQRFDAVRVLGLHAEQWPPPARLNRLLPFAAARRLPGADSRRQRAWASAVQAGLDRSAPCVEFSWSAFADGAPTAPSPLLPPTLSVRGAGDDALVVAGGVLATAAWPGAGSPEAAGRDRLEHLARQAAPPVVLDGADLRGVVGLLDLQSACPWAAFLVRRLGAEFPDVPAPFPDRAFLGRLTHEAMRALYRKHVEAGTLPDPGEVPDAVDRALASERAGLVLSPAARAAERTRLERLLREWLAFERAQSWPRPLAVERRFERDWHGVRVGVRMDRVDEFGDGVLILDYKTGAPASPTWATDRPWDVQLPLYALLLAGEAAPARGIGWLHLRANAMKQTLWTAAGEIRGRGITGMGSGRAPFADWDAAIDHWDECLSGLLDEHLRGDASFEVHHPDALRYLGIELLLRDGGAPAEGDDDDG